MIIIIIIMHLFFSVIILWECGRFFFFPNGGFPTLWAGLISPAQIEA